MNILCPRKLLSQFRRECRQRFPKEHFAAVYGLRSDEGNFLITEVVPVKHEADRWGVKIDPDSIIESKEAALVKGVDWLGTIHSHCSTVKDPTCWHLSETDYKSALKWGEAVCGLVYVDRNGTRTFVQWYIPAPVLDVIYS